MNYILRGGGVFTLVCSFPYIRMSNNTGYNTSLYNTTSRLFLMEANES